MIVIADDLTGAAEIGGIALRFNLTVEIVKTLNVESEADVQIINTNARSLNKEEALRKINAVYTEVEKLRRQEESFKSAFIYIKTDSVLRGYIADELHFALQSLQYKKVLLVPANPSLDRKVIDGRYYIGETLLHETDFANDPEFPAKSSKVTELVEGSKSQELATNGLDKAEGILIGNATSEDDLSSWAAHHQEEILFAGGAAFFKSLLEKRYVQFTKDCREHIEMHYPVLYVCGSAFGKSAEWISKKQAEGYPTFYLTADNRSEAANKLIEILKDRARVIFAVSKTISLNPEEIRKAMAKIVNGVVKEMDSLEEIIIEGGATAALILDELAINSLAPVQEISPGVIRCITYQHNKKMITLKPGSYSWPLDLWKF